MNALGHWQDTVFRLAPTLTLHSLNGQSLAVSAFPGKACVLDAVAVTEIDSIGIAAVLNVYRAARAADVHLDLQGANAHMMRLLHLYELEAATLGQTSEKS